MCMARKVFAVYEQPREPIGYAQRQNISAFRGHKPIRPEG